MFFYPKEFLIFTLLFCNNALATNSCQDLFLKSTVTYQDRATTAQSTLASFAFPSEGNFPLNDVQMRKALYEAFSGRDFYRNEPIPFENMVIDHIVPRALGGPDNIFNYVPTIARLNGKKSASFDQMSATAILAIVRTVYAPRVLEMIAKVEKPKKVDTSNDSPYKPTSRARIRRVEYSLGNISEQTRETLINLAAFMRQSESSSMAKSSRGIEIVMDAAAFEKYAQINISDFAVLLSQVRIDEMSVYSSGKKSVTGQRNFLIDISIIDNKVYLLIENRFGGLLLGDFTPEHLRLFMNGSSFLTISGM